jgi:ligand-binding SRPBCC domain-containing protein
MPRFEISAVYPRPLPDVFDFFRQPANLVRITPPELHMQLIEGPERVELGSRIVLQGRRWGVPQRLVSEITAFERNQKFVDEQRQGPFRSWRHTHDFAEVPEGTRTTDVIEFEPPGGMLGFLVTAAFVERDLKWLFEYRNEKLKELLR